MHRIRYLIRQKLDLIRGENRNQNIKIVRRQEKVGLEADKPEPIRRHRYQQV